MANVQRKLVHKQFNSPMGLYSPENIQDTLNRELRAFGNDGIEIDDHITRPLNLASSEVLRAVEEEEQMKCGYKRVAWPPTSEERIVREFTPQPQTQYQPVPPYNQQLQQPSAAPPAQDDANQQYRASSFDNNRKPQQQYQINPQQQHKQLQQQQYPPQPHYQAQAPQTSQNLYQQAPQPGPYYQQTAQQPIWLQQPPIQQQQQQQYQQPPWIQSHQNQQQQPQYQNPLNQYNQAPHHYHNQQQQQQQQQYPLQQNQFIPQTNQEQFNSYSQHQQKQHTVSHDQVDQQQHQPPLSQDQRGTSPGIITLRKEAPITQKPAPVYTSQPAAISFRGGSNMRGDLKWPPPEYKEAAAKENEERRKLALGPVCRPRKVNRDYTSFFAKNALSHHYPSYKVPPGTQHMIN